MAALRPLDEYRRYVAGAADDVYYSGETEVAELLAEVERLQAVERTSIRALSRLAGQAGWSDTRPLREIAASALDEIRSHGPTTTDREHLATLHGRHTSRRADEQPCPYCIAGAGEPCLPVPRGPRGGRRTNIEAPPVTLSIDQHDDTSAEAHPEADPVSARRFEVGGDDVYVEHLGSTSVTHSGRRLDDSCRYCGALPGESCVRVVVRRGRGVL